VTRIPTDPEQIRQLAAVMAEAGLSEVEISDKDTRVRVVRGAVVAAAPMATGASVMAVTPAPPAPQMPALSPIDAAATHPGAITSPMVGVAYLAPEPGAPHFVSVGQQVTAGQTLLLIEAMKTFNEIKAPSAGTVTKILVQNSSPVEYGEVLMIVE
jgi:acetyl-CoA carboxylase biotin carboxyl carrier protein